MYYKCCERASDHRLYSSVALLNVLLYGEIRPTQSTTTTRVETVKVDWARLQIWVSGCACGVYIRRMHALKRAPHPEQDVGGRESLRPYWRHHYLGTQGVVFVIDAADALRIEAAGAELAALAADDQLAGVPILIIANKAGAPGALGREALLDRLGLPPQAPLNAEVKGATPPADTAGPLRGHSWELHLCSSDAPTREALAPGLAFLLRSMHRI